MSIADLQTKLAALAVIPPAVEGQPAPAPAATVQEHARRGCVLEVTVPAERAADAAHVLDAAGFMLDAITGVDWMAEGQFEAIYDYTLWASGERVTVRARVPRDKPELPTISGIFPGANWHEREAHDFFGLVFTGHPNLAPLLLPEDATFHPLRKDYGA